LWCPNEGNCSNTNGKDGNETVRRDGRSACFVLFGMRPCKPGKRHRELGRSRGHFKYAVADHHHYAQRFATDEHGDGRILHGFRPH